MNHGLIIAVVRLFEAIPDWRFAVLFKSKFPLFVHVSSTDQLYAKVVPKHLRPHLGSFDPYSLEVALVTVEDDKIFLQR